MKMKRTEVMNFNKGRKLVCRENFSYEVLEFPLDIGHTKYDRV